MPKSEKDKRKYARYDTDLKVFFQLNYDLATKVEFQIAAGPENKILSKKYLALSKNISAAGMCFISVYELKIGDILQLEVYLPQQENPIRMQGTVCWSRVLAPSGQSGEVQFDTGIELSTVNEQAVLQSVHFDPEYRVIWSEVLESVFGSFRIFMQKQRNNK